MAKKSSIEKNLNRKALVKRFATKREALKALIMNKSTPMEERFAAQLKFAKLPRNSAQVRVRNRCEVTGRARGYYRRFKLSRIIFRQMASIGMIPGVAKSSWS